jgi:hypothetical protein
MNATLVYSCKPTRAAYEPSPATKLFHAILREKYSKSKSIRVNFRNNKYHYSPTDDYKNYVIRFRGVKKSN